MSQPPAANLPAPATHPGGCYLLFNSLINWEASEKLIHVCAASHGAGFKEINVCLSSPGGALVNAFYAYNILRALPVRIITHNVGDIRSCANILFAAGDVRFVASTSIFFFHEAWLDGAGQQNTTAASKRLQSLQKEDERTIAVLSERTGQAPETVREWHERDLTLDAREAVELGVADAVKELVIPSNAYIERIIVG